MIITIDTTQPIGSLELSVITTLLDRLAEPKAEEPKKRTRKPKIEAEPGPEIQAAPDPWESTPKAEPETEGPTLGSEPQEKGPTLDDAVKKATELIAAGQSEKIRAALPDGVRRVSELTDDQVPAFLTALEG